MHGRIIFITGTDTDVGKTVFADLLTCHLRQRGLNAIALKPVCSGGRGDAVILRRAGDNQLSLDEVNPWHYQAALAPSLAAKREGKKLGISQVIQHIHNVGRRFDVVLIEGAGGLLSPMGENFDSRDLILRLKATPVVVSLNRLGVVNQVRLVSAALPNGMAQRARIVLVDPMKRNLASRTNIQLLSKFLPAERIMKLPWLSTEVKRKKWLSTVRISEWLL
jgi:dethiobiotin synthetase